MGKGMWVVAITAFITALIACTLYFENSISESKAMVNDSEEEFAKPAATFEPVIESEFSVTVEEVDSDSDKEGENFNWVYGEVVIEKEMDVEDFYIVLEYSNVKNTPNAAMCYTPDFSESFSAFTVNENMSGEIIFKPQTFKKGVWYIVLSTNESLGTYTAYGIEKSEYEKLKNPEILKPRDLDAPGALLPDE